MHLDHAFEVGAGVDEAWLVLMDLGRVARGVPGVEVSEVVEGEHRGSFRVEAGPVSASYRGAASFQQIDAGAYRVVVVAGGRDRNGNGNVRAEIAVSLAPLDERRTSVKLSTELTLTGNMLRLGVEAVGEVGERLFRELVENVYANLLPAPAVEAPAPAPVAAEAPAPAPAPAPAGKGLLDTVTAAARRLRPLVTLAALVVLASRVLEGRRRRQSSAS